jgi:hypothetical protein
MSFKLLIVIISFVIVSCAVRFESPRTFGYIVDADTHLPIDSVLVEELLFGKNVITNQEGYFEIPVGKKFRECTTPGFEPSRRPLYIVFSKPEYFIDTFKAWVSTNNYEQYIDTIFLSRIPN